MAKEFAKAFYNSTAWCKCKDSYIQHVSGLCERCMKKGIIKAGYIVHHKEYLNPANINNPDISLGWDNLEYLCLDCHNQEHGIKSIVEKRYMFDSEGNVIPKAPLDT